MIERGHHRASDADRERIAERLRHAATEGRLVPEELDERLGSALRARTYSQLRALVADLPSPTPVRRLNGLPRVVVYAAAAVAIFTLVAVAIAALALAGMIWILWFVAGWAFFWRRGAICAARRRRVTPWHAAQLRGPARGHWM